MSYRSGAETVEPKRERRTYPRNEQLRERVRSLLADRFAFKLRVTAPGDQRRTRNGRGRSQGFAATIAMLKQKLSDAQDRPVLDKTGLTRDHNYLLEWTPDSALVARPEGPDPAPQADSPTPTIFTALQEPWA